ncbi:MAG TPA: DoxX family protein [Bryobacteraceae bacterium]|jgi:putative oxidoreductase|nr:DoxX family protein [Bryobacteraceae bacterium]
MENSLGKMQGLGIALLRWIVGVVFLVHGGQKLFVFHLAGTAAFFAKAGIPLPEVSAVVVTLVEFLGGAALILGIGTRAASVLLAVNMLGAIYFVHGRNGFFLQSGGYEYALAMLVSNVSLALTGPGICAIDNLIGKRRLAEPTSRPVAA